MTDAISAPRMHDKKTLKKVLRLLDEELRPRGNFTVLEAAFILTVRQTKLGPGNEILDQAAFDEDIHQYYRLVALIVSLDSSFSLVVQPAATAPPGLNH